MSVDMQTPEKQLSQKQQKQKRCCVLLVCVYDTIVFEISNDLVYNRFHEFGTIVRILIFERKEVTKLFVQYQNPEQASKAKQQLDGKKLCNNICKMCIYFSTFDNVDLKHETTQGLDFQNDPFMKQDNYSVESFTNRSPTKNFDEEDQFYAFGLGSQGKNYVNTFFPRSKTDNKNMQWHISQLNKQETKWNGLLYIDETIKSDIDSILNCQQSPSKWSTNSQKNNQQRPIGAITPKLKSTEIKDESLTVLGFKFRHPIEAKHVYNLFSNFGNISMIYKNKQEIKIKFRTIQFAAIAKNYLNNTWFYDNKIEINSYSSNSIQMKEGQYCEIVCFDQNTDRFTAKKSITINPPSKVLHVSGLKKEKCNNFQIKNMFNHVAEVKRIKILKQNADKNMALVEFNSLQQSFDVIGECHNMMIGGRKIQISFTKSQV